MWHQPPRIKPNYGKRRSLMPKTGVSKVLLHDNVSQQQLLDVELDHLSLDHKRRQRLIEQRRKTFLIQQSFKQQQLRALGITHLSFLPEEVAQSHLHMARFTQPPSTARPLAGKVKDTETPTPTRPGTKVKGSRPPSVGVTRAVSVDVNTDDSIYSGRTAKNRSVSCVPHKSDNFLTHNYQLRREKTLPANPGANHLSSRSVDDPRFACLQTSLSDSRSSRDSFLQLSPSGREVMAKYGDKPLYDYSFLKDMLHTYGGVDKGKFMQPRGEGKENRRQNESDVLVVNA